MVILFFLTLFILGAAVGSFVEVVVTRGLAGESIRGRSRCLNCATPLRWYELIPVFSYIFLHGKCGSCGVKLAREMLVVELVAGVLFVFVGWLLPFPVALLFLLPSISFALILFLFDLKGSVLPDRVSVPWIFFLLMFAALMRWTNGDWIKMVEGAVVGGGFFGLQYLVSRGRWVGDGDIRLGVIMGLLLGWPMVLVGLLLAYVSGAIISLCLLAARKVKLSSPIPFGVFLIPALFITLLWGHQLVQWYVSLW